MNIINPPQVSDDQFGTVFCFIIFISKDIQQQMKFLKQVETKLSPDMKTN